ncbi:hypothetical protein TWF694_001354 [Orbilia ellipsospora]|uniref:Clr5 domain-containing protein n=1 Tax=Orbilia ellipsospora TaxID=2528407 RepID=A0AAV9XRT2_9PEZI
MKNFDFRQCSPANTRKRQYKWTASWDSVRDFVSREIERGVPHMSIIAKLDEQGRPIKEYQFKRLLKQWGLSDRNLRQKHRKHIFDTERKAQQKGINIRRWRFKDTGQLSAMISDYVDSRTKMDSLDIEASPGQLAASPFDVIDAPKSLDATTDIVSQANDQEQNRLSLEDDFPHFPESNADSDIFGETGGHEFVEESEDDDHCHPTIRIPEKMTLSFKYHTPEPPELKSFHTAKQSNDGGIGMVQSQTIFVESNDFLQRFCDDMPQSLETPNYAQPNLQDPDILDSLAPRELVEYLSQIFRVNLECEIANNMKAAEEYKRNVENLQHEKNISRRQSERLVNSQGGLWDQYRILSYREALYNLTDSYKQANHKVESIYDEMYEIYYKNIPYLWKAVGSDNATFRNASGETQFTSKDRRVFRELVVHLPYLQARFGAAHFITVTAACHFLSMMGKYSALPEMNIFLTETHMSILNSIPFCPCLKSLLTRGRSGIIEHHLLQDDYVTAGFKGMQNLYVTNEIYGGDSLYTLEAATILRYTMKGMLSTYGAAVGLSEDYAKIISDIRDGSDYLNTYCWVTLTHLQPIPLLTFETENLAWVVLDTMLYQVRMGCSNLALRAAKLLESNMFAMLRNHAHLNSESEVIDSSKLCWRFQILQAEAYNNLGNHLKAIEALKRYTEPVLERVLKICEEKDNSEQNPFYHSILFAVHSVAFQLVIEDNKQIVNRITYLPDD